MQRKDVFALPAHRLGLFAGQIAGRGRNAVQIGRGEFQRIVVVLGEEVLPELHGRERQLLVDRLQTRLPLGVEQRSGAHETAVGLLQQTALLGVESQRGATVVDGFDPFEKFPVETDLVGVRVVDTVQNNAIEFSDAASCAITTVVPVMGKKPAAIGATNLINVAPDSENYSKGEALYQSSISSNLSEEILDGLRTDTDKLGYYLYATRRGKINTIIGVLILEWPEASQEVEGANKDELKRVIAGAGLISSSDYYQAEDYYNGKTTSSDGFWQDFQTALKTAKEILDNITATQEDVNGLYCPETCIVQNY